MSRKKDLLLRPAEILEAAREEVQHVTTPSPKGDGFYGFSTETVLPHGRCF